MTKLQYVVRLVLRKRSATAGPLSISDFYDPCSENLDDNPCNRCRYESYKRAAQKIGAAVHVFPCGLSHLTDGVDLFVVPRGQTLDRDREGPHWKAWFLELPDTCACHE